MKHKFRFLFILAPVALVALAGIVTMGLWNWLMPALFGLGAINFLQAAGIFILAKILFGHKGSHGWHGHPMRFAHAGGSCGSHSSHHGPWMDRRLQNMTPEQKERFAGRCGYPYRESEPESTKEADKRTV